MIIHITRGYIFNPGGELIVEQCARFSTLYSAKDWEVRGFKVDQDYKVETTPFQDAQELVYDHTTRSGMARYSADDTRILLCEYKLRKLFNEIPLIIYYRLL